MNRKSLLSTVVTLVAVGLAVGLAAAALSGAASSRQSESIDPSSFGTAQLGSLKVVSGVVITEKNVVLNGGWYDDKISCRKNRRLRVKAKINISAPGAMASRNVNRSGSFLAPNCAEGGPSVGFTITARQAKSACADGSWKPGAYSFMTTTTEPARKLKAVDSLVWQVDDAC